MIYIVVSKNKLLKKYRIKYGLDKGKKKTFVEDGNENKYFVKSSNPKRMTIVNQFSSRTKNPKPSLDIETLDNGFQKSKTYYDFLMEEKMEWEKSETK